MKRMAIMEGYVCGEPQEKGTSTGYMLMFSFNSPDNRRKPDGTWESVPNYFDCKLFYTDAHDPKAELVKGKQGRMLGCFTPRQDRWEKDGEKKSRATFTVESIAAVPSKPKDGDTEYSDFEIPF